MSDPGVAGGGFDAWLRANIGYVMTGIAALFGVLGFFRGLGLIRDALRAQRVMQRMSNFPSVPGEIVKSEQHSYRISRSGYELYYPYIQYRYTVNGKTYLDTHMTPGEFVPGHGTVWVTPWLTAYPVGRHIEVFYDPTDPRISVVERQAARTPRDHRRDIVIGLLVIVFSLGAVAFVVWKFLPLLPRSPAP